MQATIWKSMKTVPETGVKSDLHFVWGHLSKKTNGVILIQVVWSFLLQRIENNENFW